MKTKKRNWHLFTGVFVLLALLLATVSNRLTSTVTIQGEDTQAELTNSLSSALEAVSIVRARNQVANADWLMIEGDPTEKVSQYIEENVGNSIRSLAETLKQDSNLAWVVRYKSEEFRHNWKDSYADEEGALSFTIRNIDGKITYAGAIQPSVSFTRARSILVNPSLVPQEHLEQYGTEYLYSLTLPEDFSIQFFVPKTLQPDGGMIVKTAAEISTRPLNFCLLAGAIVMLLFIFCVPYRFEEDFFLLKKIRRLKFLVAAVLLCTGTVLACSWAYQVSMSHADGSLIELYRSFSMSANQANVISYLSVSALWMLLFGLIGLLGLYMRCELKRGEAFIYEDSLLYWGMQKGKDWVMRLFDSENRLSPEFRIVLLACLYVISATVLMILCALFMNFDGLLIGALLSLLFAIGVIYFWGRNMVRNYRKVYGASHRLAEGRFSEVTDDEVGMYQPLYNELLHISDSYENALKEGLSSQVSKAQLISNVSHDLKTPVAGIQSYSELISMSDNMDDIHHYASQLTNYSARLNALIVDLFDITKATSGDIVLNPVLIDLRELVEQVDAEWQDRLSGSRLTSLKTLNTSVMIRLDPDKMVRVMDNLYSNVIKYAMPGTRVLITLAKRGEFCELRIRNTSKTILDFDPERIMDRFVRGDASRSEAGSGLGLAIVKSFVEIQGGSFEIECDGDLFTARIRFPIEASLNEPSPAAAVQDIHQPEIPDAAPAAEEVEQPAFQLDSAPRPDRGAAFLRTSARGIGRLVSQSIAPETDSTPGAAFVLPYEGAHTPLPDLPASPSQPNSVQTGLKNEQEEQALQGEESTAVSIHPAFDDILLAASVASLKKEGRLPQQTDEENSKAETAAPNESPSAADRSSVQAMEPGIEEDPLLAASRASVIKEKQAQSSSNPSADASDDELCIGQ